MVLSECFRLRMHPIAFVGSSYNHPLRFQSSVDIHSIAVELFDRCLGAVFVLHSSELPQPSLQPAKALPCPWIIGRKQNQTGEKQRQTRQNREDKSRYADY